MSTRAATPVGPSIHAKISGKTDKSMHTKASEQSELQRLRQLVEDTFGAQMVERVARGESPSLEAGRNLQVSILFFDLRNSTAISERLTPQQLSEFLSELFTDVMDLIYGNNGFVNKLIGDGILSTFGCPVSHGDDAFNAARCALQIRDYLNTYNDLRPEYLTEPLRAGLGLASGSVFAGSIGSVRHREYAVLGDPVNVASRLEGLTKRGPFDILMDGATHEAIKDRVRTRRVLLTHVRGRQEALTIYTLDGLTTI